MIRSLPCLVLNLLLLAALAAADEDDYDCSKPLRYDATLKGNISSPLYGKRPQYPNMLSCAYNITAPVGHKIKLTFRDFDVDVSNLCEQDMVVILDKHLSVKLATLCGSELPRPFLSTDNEIPLLFITDFIQGGRGFVIEYESGPDMRLCEHGYEVCRNRNCYSIEKRCDNVDDCGDGTDEENCPHALVVAPSDCGTPEITPRLQDLDRVVGGEEAVPNSWPWQVSLQLNNTEPNGHHCGGTLINTLWVLTATHCVVNFPHPGEIKIVLGSHGKFTKTKYQQVRWSKKVIAYKQRVGEGIKNFDYENELSLIRLNAPVELNAGVHPACLPNYNSKLKLSQVCYATGWGETRGTGSSNVLKQTFQFILKPNKCKYFENANFQLCVGNNEMSICRGDSGGPLVCLGEGNKWFVVGAASQATTGDGTGRGICAGPGAYAIYVASSPKRYWIEDIIEKYN